MNASRTIVGTKKGGVGASSRHFIQRLLLLLRTNHPASGLFLFDFLRIIDRRSTLVCGRVMMIRGACRDVTRNNMRDLYCTPEPCQEIFFVTMEDE